MPLYRGVSRQTSSGGSRAETQPLLNNAHSNGSLPVANGEPAPPEVVTRVPTRSRARRTLMVLIILECVLSGCQVALMIPFFPAEANDKDISQTLISAVFSSFAVAQLLCSPLTAWLTPLVGASRMFNFGLATSAVSAAVFGTLNLIANSTTFIVCCFLVRAVEALGAAAITTSGFTIVANQFPDDTNFMLGVTETAGAVGLALAPAIGSGLYGLGGYGMPFYVLGASMFLLVIINCFAMPEVGAEADGGSAGGSWHMLTTFSSSRENWLCCTVVFTAAAIWSSGDSTIAPYASDTLGIGPSQLGLYFLVATGSYVITSMLFGRLADRYSNSYVIISVCLAFSAVGLVLTPPSKFLGLQPAWWLLGLGLTIQEMFLGGAYLPCFHKMLTNSLHLGLEDSLATQAFISGVLSTVFSLGSVVGPVVAGVLVDFYDFSLMMTSFAGWTAVLFIFTTTTAVQVHRRKRREIAQLSQPT